MFASIKSKTTPNALLLAFFTRVLEVKVFAILLARFTNIELAPTLYSAAL